MSAVDANIETAEQTALRSLAYYDARNVPDDKVRIIFQCTQSELEGARSQDFYKDCLQIETEVQQQKAAEVDDLWDDVEKQALGDLKDSLMVSSDPRLALAAAQAANKAGRRRTGGAAIGQERATIDANGPQLGTTRVIRLRTSFMERLTSDTGQEQLVERQMEVEASTRENINEEIDPRTMKDLLRNKIGVDPTDLAKKSHFGPDAMLDITVEDYMPEE